MFSLIAKFSTNESIQENIEKPQQPTNEKPPIHHTFKLPITYLEENRIHALSPTVSNDLELSVIEPEKPTMYEHLFKPKHVFARNMIPEWNKQYTTDVAFLQDTQNVLCNMSSYSERTRCSHPVECDKIMEIWKDTKEDPVFLEKYCYIEWDMFKQFNESSSFLQALTVINMSSPLISFIIPIIFLIFPFILLKIQGIPITLDIYFKVLKDIAKNHFIGRALSGFQNISWTSILYLVFMVGLYGLQMYQNTMLCIRFYRNISKINTHLCVLRDYLKYSISSMENFTEINNKMLSYNNFHSKTKQESIVLKSLYEELKVIQPFTPGFSKITEIGYLLKCFYRIHSHIEYENALRYSFGFEGFINNLTGVYENMVEGKVHCSLFGNEKCEFKEEYYPALVSDKNCIKNNCDLSTNIIITGPNASGKTTILKTTTINIIFTQQLGCGFYKSGVLQPYTHIHSYLNIPDTSGRDSLFQAESRRCKEILDIISSSSPESRHHCIFDELYSGTNPVEATKSAYAFLKYLSKHENVDFILTTHYVKLCKKMKKAKRVENYKMVVEKDPQTKALKYTYRIKKGISKIQGAISILEEMRYPTEILNDMRSC